MVDYVVIDNIAILTINNPPVNSLRCVLFVALLIVVIIFFLFIITLGVSVHKCAYAINSFIQMQRKYF